MRTFNELGNAAIARAKALAARAARFGYSKREILALYGVEAD